jgi:membrane protease YdiL (CAAX protease family)
MAGRTQARREPGPSALRHFVFAPGPSVRNGALYYLLSLFVFLAAAFGLQELIGFGIRYFSADNAALRSLLRGLIAGPQSLSWQALFIVLAISFGTYWIALAVAVELVHGRRLLSVLTDRARFDWPRFAGGFLFYLLLLAGPFVLYVAFGNSGLRPHFRADTFGQLLLLSTTVLLLQSATEEAIFRGYFTQFIASFTDVRILIAGVPSALFAAAHIGNPEFAADPTVLGFYFLFGLFMSLTAMRERSLELVIGAHFANNLVNAVLLRTPESVLQTPAIFVLPSYMKGEPFVVAAAGLIAPIIYWIVTAYWWRPGDPPRHR